MPIYHDGKKMKPYRGYRKPVNIYYGDKKVAGWKNSTQTGNNLTFQTTYNDTADVEVTGNTVQQSEWAHKTGLLSQDGIPTPEAPIPIVSNLPAGKYKTKDYWGNWYEFTLTDDLRGINGVFDSVEWDKYGHGGYLRKKTIKYKSPFTATTYVELSNTCQSVIKTAQSLYDRTGYCTSFVVRADFLDNEHIVIGGTLNTIFMHINKTRLSTPDLAGVNDWLANNTMEIVATLATPTRTPLTFTRNDSSTAPECPMEFLTNTPSLEYPAEVYDAQGSVKARGKNLFDKNLIPHYVNATRIVTDTGITVSAGTSLVTGYVQYEYQLIPNTTYRLKALSTRTGISGGGITVVAKSANQVIGGGWATLNPSISFTTPNDGKILFRFYGKTSEDSVQSATFSEVQLELGSTATPYEPYRPEVTTPIPALRSVGTVKDTFNVRTGVKVKNNSDWVTLDGNKLAGANAASGLTGIRSLYTAANYPSLGNVAKGYKFDTTPLAQATSGENAGWANSADSKLYITANMNDTGWSNAYVPTLAEVQAFGYGFKMTHQSGLSPFYKSEIPYNPTTWAEFHASASGVTKESTGVTFTSDGANNKALYTNPNRLSLKVSTKYGFLYNVVSSTISANKLQLDPNSWSFTPSYLPYAVGNQKHIRTSKTTFANNDLYLALLPDTSGNAVKIKDIRVYELPTGSQIETDFTNLTADQLNEKYPFDGLNVKHWKRLMGTDAEIQASITPTLPTASYTGFTPYKMIYQLAEPIEEQYDPVTLPTYYPQTIVTTTNDTVATLSTTVTVKTEE